MTVTSASTRGKIFVLGTHLPRQCGIATFTSDLSTAIAQELGASDEVPVIALDDTARGYRYPHRVWFSIRADSQADYMRAAKYVNARPADAVLVQHEYGIFGGPAGAHILHFMRRIHVPAVTTLHTVLADPSSEEREVMEELCRLSNRIVVMCDAARDILESVYRVPASRIAHIPHGIPDLPYADPGCFKDRFTANGSPILLTFGLLSPGKGIEFMIDAMSQVISHWPDALYIVLGATHPHLKREQGESYRIGLQKRVHELGLSDNVRFVNEFVEIPELGRYLQAADIYVTPYLGEAQITSGTLAYALGAGKAVVSTPYKYAQDSLADGRGLLVPFRDSNALAQAVVYLLRNDDERLRMCRRAYLFARPMTWSEVARQYLRLARVVIAEKSAGVHAQAGARRHPTGPASSCEGEVLHPLVPPLAVSSAS